MLLARLRLSILILFCFAVGTKSQTVFNNSTPFAQDVSAEKNLRVPLGDYFQKAAGLGFSGSVLVAHGGKILFRNGYGWADAKGRIAIKTETIIVID